MDMQAVGGEDDGDPVPGKGLFEKGAQGPQVVDVDQVGIVFQYVTRFVAQVIGCCILQAQELLHCRAWSGKDTEMDVFHPPGDLIDMFQSTAHIEVVGDEVDQHWFTGLSSNSRYPAGFVGFHIPGRD